MAASATEIAEAVAAGATRAVDVLDEHEARHKATAAAINALVQPRHVAARAEAVKVDAAGRDSGTWGPLAGVPVSVKECFPIAGTVTSLGIPTRRSFRDTVDAPIVARLRDAGGLIVGKANVSQAMFLHDSDNPVWGRTNHPHDATRGPGGSSGGDAALVAAGVVPLAVGTDLAGSIRQPAHACGIVGFLPRSMILGDGGGFDTMPELRAVRPRAGFLARSVEDLALGFTACTGLSLASCDAPRGPRQGPLRIAWWDDAGPLEPSAAVRRAVHEATERLSRAGATLVRIDGRLADDAAWLHLAILSADGGAAVRQLFGGSRPIPPVARLLRLAGVPRWQRQLLAVGAGMAGSRIESQAVRTTGPRHADAFDALLEERSSLARRCAMLAESFDAAVCPVSALPALRHGTAMRLVVAAAPCLLANLLDLPAGTVPVTRVRAEEERGRGWSLDPVVRAAADTDRGSAGLPVGVQVIGLHDSPDAGPHRGESVVLQVMRLIAGDGV